MTTAAEVSVSVLVVAWNSGTMLEALIEALARQVGGPYETVVLDNASSDGVTWPLLSDLADRHPEWLSVVRSARNLGYAGGMNRAVGIATGGLVCTLNPDTVPEPDFIARLAAAFADQQVGWATGRLLRPRTNGDQPHRIDSTGHVFTRARLFRNRGEGEQDGPGFDVDDDVFGATGAAAMYRRSMLDDLACDGQVFDEDLFAYWEDVDLDWRAQVAGWRCRYVAGAVCIHERGGAGPRRTTRVEHLNFRNRLLVVAKNDDPVELLKHLPGVAFTTVLKTADLLVTHPKALVASADVLRLLPRAVRRRGCLPPAARDRRRVVARAAQPFPYATWLEGHGFRVAAWAPRLGAAVARVRSRRGAAGVAGPSRPW